MNNKVDFIFLSTVNKSKESNKPILEREYNVFSSDMEIDELRKFLKSFDIIIIGACQDRRIFRILPRDKIYFHNGEHYWKKFNTPLSLAKRIFRTVELKRRYRHIKPYILANSSYLVEEFERFNISHKESFKFGYFPPVNDDESCVNKEREKTIMFAGRLLKWKRPFLCIDVLKELLKAGQNYKLSIIGEGEMLPSLKNKIRKLGLEKHVVFNGFLQHDELLDYMKNSSIFVFSSNHQEGWGAVLNEALSCGCIVFSSSLAGSTKFLVKDGNNGFIFKTKAELISRIREYAIFSNDECIALRKNAFNTINKNWNEKVAAERLYFICASLLEKKRIDYYNDGPLSLIN